MTYHIRICILLLGTFPFSALGDENLTTPYIMLNPDSITTGAAVGTPLPRSTKQPGDKRRVADELAMPRIVCTQPTSDTELITLTNASLAFTITIDALRSATITSLRSNVTNMEFLSKPSGVFRIGERKVPSSSYRVKQWHVSQGPEVAELVVQLRGINGDKPDFMPVIWTTRLYRSRPQIEQSFRVDGSNTEFCQILETTASLRPVMPANLFALGFTNGKPNLTDHRRFEVVTKSDHVGYDAARGSGLWAFASDTGGWESIIDGRVSFGQDDSSSSTSTREIGPFILQPFEGPVELGFAQLRDFIQQHYAVQKTMPAAFEWNQFWLWQGGPVNVDYSVVTEQRLFDTLQRVVPMGLEELHLDAGWQQGPGQWQLDSGRFPGGWKRIREFNRKHGLGFHLWVNDGNVDTPGFLTDLIEKTDLNRIFIDRIVTDKTLEAIEQARVSYPGLSVNVHGSTTCSEYWTWGNLHYLKSLNQIYFGEGQYWAWSNIRPEAKVGTTSDPLFPQKEAAERFFSRHDMAAGDLITRSAAYQAHWVWPFNCVMPPHGSIDWFEKRTLPELKSRIFTYLACKFKYEWGFDPIRLTPETISFHKNCTAWFKANRDYLTVYQHVLDPPNGVNVDAVGHLIGQRGYVFLFNPGDKPQQVPWQSILWEPELQLTQNIVTLSDWSGLTSFSRLPEQTMNAPVGNVEVPAHDVKVIGLNLECDDVLQRVKAEHRKLISGERN